MADYGVIATDGDQDPGDGPVQLLPAHGSLLQRDLDVELELPSICIEIKPDELHLGLDQRGGLTDRLAVVAVGEVPSPGGAHGDQFSLLCDPHDHLHMRVASCIAVGGLRWLTAESNGEHLILLVSFVFQF